MAEEEEKQVEEVDETTSTEAETQKLTQEEIDALKAEGIEEGRELGKKEEFNRTNSLLSEQGAKIKRLEEQLSQPSPSRIKRDELLLDDMKARQTETGEVNPRIAQLEAEIEAERKRDNIAQQAHTKQVQETIGGYQKRVEVLGLGEDDLDYWEIKGWVEKGEYKPAELKLRKLEKEKKPVETDKSKETEEDRVKKLVKEGIDAGLKVEMDKRGMLNSDNNLPSGAGGKLTIEQVKKMSPEERANRASEIAKLPLSLGGK